MHATLIRDCLWGADRERLRTACSRPCWTVASDEFYAGHCFTSSGEGNSAQNWRLHTTHSSNQLELAGLVQYISDITHRRSGGFTRLAPIPHQWQAEPLLLARVTLTFRFITLGAFQHQLAGKWRIWTVEQNNRVTRIDAAQYHMLLAMNEAQEMDAPTAQFLVNLSTSCRAQKAAD
jgi:hypothetical protein